MKAYDIAAARKQGRVTQRQLADKLGWTPGALVDVELGRVDITEEQYRAIHATLRNMLDTLSAPPVRTLAATTNRR